MTQLNRQIWKSSISVSTKVCLYKVYILPVLLYCCDTWTVTKQLSDRTDAFDMWCLWKIPRITYTRHVTNVEVRRVTGCSDASRLVCIRRRQLFSHLTRRPDEKDHHRVLVAAMSNPLTGWRRPIRRPWETWPRTVSKDVQPFNIGIHSAWHRAADHQQWHELVDIATLQ